MAVTKINYNNKRSGDLWSSNDVNEVKSVVNNNADELTAAKAAIETLQRQSFASVVSQTALSLAIEPNVLNVWSSAISSLAVTFNAGTSGRPNEYMLEFTVSGDSFTLTLPNNVRWAIEPEWQDGYTYQVSILDNLAIYAGWEAAAS